MTPENHEPRLTLEVEQTPVETDDRYIYAAMREILGPEYKPGMSLSIQELSRVARRAAEIKRDELAKAERSPQ